MHTTSSYLSEEGHVVDDEPRARRVGEQRFDGRKLPWEGRLMVIRSAVRSAVSEPCKNLCAPLFPPHFLRATQSEF